MGPWGILVLALGLAADATAVAAARGLAARRVGAGDVLRVAAVFGGYHVLMPLLGWTLGRGVGPWVEAWDHWIAFVLLTALGVRMLWEAASGASESETSESGAGLSLRGLLGLGLATSVDALAVGISLPLMGAPLGTSVACIGLVAALASGSALWAGRHLGAAFGPRVDALGGLVLIGVGLHTLLSHLAAR